MRGHSPRLLIYTLLITPFYWMTSAMDSWPRGYHLPGAATMPPPADDDTAWLGGAVATALTGGNASQASHSALVLVKFIFSDFYGL